MFFVSSFAVHFNHLQLPSNQPHPPDAIIRFHRPQQSIVESGHEEAFGEIVEVVRESENVPALPARACVNASPLHARTEGADGSRCSLRRLI